MESPIDRAAEAAGGLSRLAVGIGVSTQAASNWRNRGIPIEHCPAIERLIAGAVTRRDLRPDDWHRIWPELVTADHPAPAEAKAA